MIMKYDFRINRKFSRLFIKKLSHFLLTIFWIISISITGKSQLPYSKTESGLFIRERERKDIVIGAPHHTLGGVKELPCPEHIEADENTGFIAQRIAEKLNLSSIIACNATIDYNKYENSEYFLKIVEWNPNWYIEIHGHGSKKVKDSVIEISSGKKSREDIAIGFSNALNQKMKEHDELKGYKAIGSWKDIKLRATKTKTITTDRWKAIHIEIPKSLRLDETKNLPVIADAFIDCLVEAINEFCN
jgi:hypothetical protein